MVDDAVRFWVALLLAFASLRATKASQMSITPSLYFTTTDGSSQYPPNAGDSLTDPIQDTFDLPDTDMTEYIRWTAERVCWSGLWRFYPLPDFHGQSEIPFYGYQLVNTGTRVGCATLSFEVKQELAAQRSLRPLGCPTEISQKCISMYTEAHGGGQAEHYDQTMFENGYQVLNLTIPVRSFYVTAPSDTEEAVNGGDGVVTVVKTFSGPNGDNSAGRRPCIVMDGRYRPDDTTRAKSYYHSLVEDGAIPFISIRGRDFGMIGASCNSEPLIQVPQTAQSNGFNGVVTIYAE